MTTDNDNHDLFAQGGDQRDDAALLALFREWRAGMRDIEGQRPAGETEDQYDVANGAVWDIARQIYDTPAAGPVGLAIKAFMLAFEVCIDDVDRPSLDEPAALGKFDLAQNHYGAGDRLYVRNHAIKGLAGDIARLVPEAVPLVAGVANSPTTHPPGERNRRAARSDLGALLTKWQERGGIVPMSEDEERDIVDRLMDICSQALEPRS